jgi:hypothetical protein
MSPLVIFDNALALSSQRIAFWGLFAAGTMVFAGIIMNVYPIRYIHLGRTMSRHPWFGRANLLLLTVSMFTPYFRADLPGLHDPLPPVAPVYLAYPARRRRPGAASETTARRMICDFK